MERRERDEHRVVILAGLVAAALIYVYPLFLSTPLLEPDEGLHATISQEMVEHGEWIVPTFRGSPFLDKPILYFWAQMVSLKSFGMNEGAVRLPGLFFGLLGSLTTGLLASRLFGSRTGPIAGLMSMTMLIPLSLAQAAAHDVALVPWTNLALLCLWEMERVPFRSRQWEWLAGGAFMFALAILTKGLLGIALIAVGHGLFLLLSRRISAGSCMRMGATILLGALLASPWFIAMEIRVSGYLHYYFIERHVLGFATATQRHGHEPWHYYIPFLTAGALPWIWYIAPLLRDEWKARGARTPVSPAVLFVLCWLIGGLVLLSVARSKLVTYSLPLFPAIAILCAVSWRRFETRQLSKLSIVWFATMTRCNGVLGMIAPLVGLLACQLLLDTPWSPGCWLFAFGVSGASAVSWRAFEQKQYGQQLAVCCMCVAGLVALVMTWPLQMFAEEHSERDLAAWVNQQEMLPRQLILVGEKPASLIFYLRKDIRRNLHQRDLTHLGLSQIRSMRRLKQGVVLAVTQKRLRQAAAEHWTIPGSFRESIGQFELLQSDESFLALVQTARRSER